MFRIGARAPSSCVPRVLTFVVTLGLTLTACGGDSNGGSGGDSGSSVGGTATQRPAAGGDPDPCALLTEADVQTLLGTLPSAEKTPAGPFKTCAYYASLTNFVQLQVCNCLHEDAFADAVESGADFLEVEALPVSGVGDRAFWLEGIFWVQKGDIAFNLWLSTKESFAPDGSALEGEELQRAALPKTRALALQIIDRLD